MKFGHILYTAVVVALITPALMPSGLVEQTYAVAEAFVRGALQPAQECTCVGCNCAEEVFCHCGSFCACKCGCGLSGVCGCLPATEKVVAPRKEIYMDCYRQAMKNQQPLVVWVGINCPALEKEFPNAIHFRCNEFDGAKLAGVVVGIPNNGSMDRVADFSGVPTLSQLRSVLQPPAPVIRKAEVPMQNAFSFQGQSC